MKPSVSFLVAFGLASAGAIGVLAAPVQRTQALNICDDNLDIGDCAPERRAEHTDSTGGIGPQPALDSLAQGRIRKKRYLDKLALDPQMREAVKARDKRTRQAKRALDLRNPEKMKETRAKRAAYSRARRAAKRATQAATPLHLPEHAGPSAADLTESDVDRGRLWLVDDPFQRDL